MSEFCVEVVAVDVVNDHPNADALDVVHIAGKSLQTIARKGQYTPGDIALYVPYDSVVPDDAAALWGVTSYLHNGRVRAVRLRGEMSYGFLAPVPDDASVSLGDDMSGHYGVTKYEPPPQFTAGENAPDYPQFHKYTSIENMRRYPDVFVQGEPVVATEKLHGTNSRVGITTDNDTGDALLLCGSHNMRKQTGVDGIYEIPLGVESVTDLLRSLRAAGTNMAILFGEIYGWKVQDLQYGYNSENPQKTFAAFDISLDGKYLNYEEFHALCTVFGVPVCPLLYRGPFDMDTLAALSAGNTTVNNGGHIREGLVVRPEVERVDSRIGRVVLKLVNDDYISRKGGTEAK